MKNIINDLYGGLTAAVVALPLALAFGVASGAGPQAGLYGAIVLGFIAAIFGGTPVQISGPTGPMTVVTAAAFVFLKGDMETIAGIVFLGGLIQIFMGYIRIGKLVKYIPYPVISGFMTGIGVIIVLLQIHPVVGAGNFSSPLLAVTNFSEIFHNFNPDDALLGCISLCIVFLFPKRLSSIIPSPLLALIAGTLVSVYMGLNATTIGSIPRELPELMLPSISVEHFRYILTTAISLAVLGSIDSLLTSLVSDSLTKTNHNPDKELMGQGLGNMCVSLVGGIPGAGATMRTVVNVKAGGRTRLSGVVHAIMLVLTLFIFAPMAELIPMAVLSGILIKVGFDIIDYQFLRLIKKAPKHDLIVMFIVLVLTVFVDLIVAVGAGVVAASILLTYRISKHSDSLVYDVPVSNVEKVDSHSRPEFKVRVIDINGPFFFGSTTQIVGKIGAFLGTKIVIFNCSNVPFIDYSAVFALREKLVKLKSHKILPLIVINKELKNKLIRLKIDELMPEEHIFEDLEDALNHAEKHLK
jgi:SulP family sulfate permease